MTPSGLAVPLRNPPEHDYGDYQGHDGPELSWLQSEHEVVVSTRIRSTIGHGCNDTHPT